MASAPIAALAQGLAANGGVAALRDRCLAQIAADDHQWHAMRATDVDAGVEPGVTGGALYGVPIVVKDNIDVFGMPTTSGCLALARAMPLRDAAVVARLRAAGAVLLGKTNMSELSFEIRSRSSLGGDVLCPFDPATTAGGSSGGAAVAVARGYAMAALGSDTGGSIRIPAAINGLVGFRPAHGALPMTGLAPLAPSTDTVGPITRCVADALHVFLALGGRVSPLAGPDSGIRVGVVRQAFGDDPRVLAAMDVACERLRHSGAVVVDRFAIADIEAHLHGTHIVDVEFGAAFDAYLARNFMAGTAPASLTELIASGAFLPEYEALLRQRLATDPMDAAAVLARHAALRTALQQAMTDARVECLIYPTLRVVPDSLDNPKGGWAAELAARTGWPAISVPVIAAAGARPIGAEVLMPAGDEARLFALAAVLETAI
jgi:Asp-tRNA(Asn)/Glu-tRNA(Gln) amidotransferase A subunit family amidase